MIDDNYDATLAIAPGPQSATWVRQYAAIVLALAMVFEAFALPRAAVLGFTPIDGVLAALCAGLACLVVGRARPGLLAAYTLTGFAVVEVLTWISEGFAGPAALVPCVLPLLASLFVGGRAPILVLVGSLAAFVVVGALRLETTWLPPLDARLVDSGLPANWINLALAMAAVVGPVVWVVGRLVQQVEQSFARVAQARSAHGVEVRLRVAAEEALDKAVERAQQARRAEASGLLVAGVVHDLRNHLNGLQLATYGAVADDPGDADDREAIARIRALCGEAAKVSGDLLRVARPCLAETSSRCFVGDETSAVARVLGGSLPPDFRIACASTLPKSREAGVDPHTLASTVLGIVAGAGVASAPDRRVLLLAREPTRGERASVPGCPAVVELLLGCDAVDVALASHDAGELLALRGGRVLLSLDGPGLSTRLLLPPVALTPETEDADD
jgi:signal transduction histidine kinase